MHRLVVAWKYFTESFLFLFYVRKDQVQEQSGSSSSGFAVTSRRMIIYSGN